MLVLVVNCGSSSLKYQLLDMPRGEAVAKGQVERIGHQDALLTHEAEDDDETVVEMEVTSHARAVDLMLRMLVLPEGGPLESLAQVDAVGHRVLHAGDRYSGSVLATPEVLAAIEEFAELAPLHNPHNLAGIQACQAAMPHCPHVCVFDNALHHTLAPEVYTYALPYELSRKLRIRKYGFHGLAFRSAFERAGLLLGQPVEELKVVTLMMGSGNTANAYDHGRSVEVSTGFTPQEGLVQSTRAGDLDAAVIPFLMSKEGYTPEEMTEVLNKRSGWLGISGLSADLREVIAAAEEGHGQARLALAAHAHRARKYVGAYAAAMGGVDVLIFAGSIGEKAPQVREAICGDLEFMGLELDQDKNMQSEGEAILSTSSSRGQIAVVTVNEELVIARDTLAVVQGEPV
ncbi:acetate/propionate family kinase [bacterium]|nr:acetate/propionate family kinase [bacterium]